MLCENMVSYMELAELLKKSNRNQSANLSMATGENMTVNGIHIHPNQAGIARAIFGRMTEKLADYVQEEKTDKIIISVFGGSGAGKSGIAILLAHLFRENGIKSYVMSGDNYLHRIPKENDEMRMVVYRNEGRKGLAEYLGSDKEINYSEVNHVLMAFKRGATTIRIKHMGREVSETWYEDTDFSDTSVLILEWTHGNNPEIRGIDYPVYLHSTPENTLARRLKRGRDPFADSDFVAMVLEIEQRKLEQQVKRAKDIVDIDGTFLTYREYCRKTGKRDILPMLNVYPDSMGQKLSDLVSFLGREELQGTFSSVYILPSLFHSDLDRGFSIIDYGLEEQLADEKDLLGLSRGGIDLKLDFVLNHLSVQSPQFQDLLKKGRHSAYNVIKLRCQN